MSRRLDRDDLRGAVYRADVDALAQRLAGEAWPDDALQLIGDAVLVVARGRAQDIEPAARRCVEELRERDWEGDDELAIRIESVFGWGPVPLLRPLPVDLEQLGELLEGDPRMGGGRIDLATGEVWPQVALDYAAETGEDDEEDEDGWLWVECEGSRAGYRDMEVFIETVQDETPADRLARSIQGRGAFRRFKDVLADQPGLLERWQGFSEDRQRGRARAWLAVEGYAPEPPRRQP